MPGKMGGTLCNHTATLGGLHDYSHFTDWGTGAQRSSVACLWLHNLGMVESGVSKDFLSICFDPGTRLGAQDAKKNEIWSLCSGSAQPAPFWRVAMENVCFVCSLEDNFEVRRLGTCHVLST